MALYRVDGWRSGWGSRLGVFSRPVWLAELIRPRPVSVPWERTVRALIGIAVPVAAGMAAGSLPFGLLIAIGALPATTAEGVGPYRSRAIRVGLTAIAGALGFLIGGVVCGGGWVTVAAVVAIAATSAVMSAGGALVSGPPWAMVNSRYVSCGS